MYLYILLVDSSTVNADRTDEDSTSSSGEFSPPDYSQKTPRSGISIRIFHTIASNSTKFYPLYPKSISNLSLQYTVTLFPILSKVLLLLLAACGMTTPQTIHVAILDAEIPCLSVYAKRGLFSSQFKTLLQNATSRLNKSDPLSTPLKIHTSSFDAVGGTLPPREILRTASSPPISELENAGIPASFRPIDAILITGSGFSAYDDLPWIHELISFIRLCHGQFPLIKIFGSCFGHQIIAQALLSKPDVGLGFISPESASASMTTSTTTFHVQHSPTGYEMGIQPITLKEEFKKYFPPLARADPFRIQLIHGDIVVPKLDSEQTQTQARQEQGEISLPSPWMNIGSSSACDIQGLYLPGRILTFQGHFEFDAWLNAELCREFGRRGGWETSLVEEYVRDIEKSVVSGGEEEDDDDSKVAAEAVVLFFAGRDVTHPINQEQVVSGFSGDFGVNWNGMLTPPME